MSLLELDINTHSSLPQPIKNIFVEIIGEHEANWIQDACFNEVYSYVVYTGIIPISEWTAFELITQLFEDIEYFIDAHLDLLINQDFISIFEESYNSIQFVKLTDLYEDKLLSRLSFLKPEELDLLQQNI